MDKMRKWFEDLSKRMNSMMYRMQQKVSVLQYIPGFGDFKQMLKKYGICLLASLLTVGTITQFLHSLIRMDVRFSIFKIPLFGIRYLFPAMFIGLIAYISWGLLLFLRLKSPLRDEERKFEYAPTNEFGSARPLSGIEYDECIEEVMPGETDSFILGYGIRDSKKVCCVKPTKPGCRPILSNPHVAAAGGSGAGKSWSFARPAIYQAITGGRSFIVTETSGELFQDTSEIARKHGYDVKLLNYIPDGIAHSDSCNYLKQIINGDSSKALTLATVILDNTTENKGFWDDAQKNVLTALILMIDSGCNLSEERKNLGTILDYIAEGPDKLCARISALPDSNPAKRYGQLFVHSSKQVQESALFGLGVRLQIFMEPKVRNAVAYDEVSLSAPGERKCAYYVNISDTENTFQVLSALFFNFSFVEMGNLARKKKGTPRLDIDVDVILDEFTNVGILNDFEKTISTVRKYGIRIFPIFQDIGQVMNNYPKTYTTILANCALSVYLGGNDVENTAKYYSKLYGTATVVDEAEQKPVNVFLPNIPRFHKRFTVRTKSRPIYTEDEILNLDPEYVIVKLERRGPLKLKKFDYRDHPLYQEREPCNIYEHIPEWQKRAKRIPFAEEIKPTLEEKPKDMPKVETTSQRKSLKDMQRLNPEPEKEKPNPKSIPIPSLSPTYIASAKKVGKWTKEAGYTEDMEEMETDDDESLMLHDNREPKKRNNHQKNKLQEF